MKKNYLYEVLFVVMAVLTLFTGLSLFSYSPEDPSYSNIVFSKYDESVANTFGKAGAYTADILGTAIGWASLLLPFGLIYMLIQMVKRYRGRSTRGMMLLSFFTVFIFLAAMSVLSGLVGDSDPFFAHKQAGGVLGVTGSTVVKSVLGQAGGVILCVIVLLLCLLVFARLTPSELMRWIACRVSRVKDGSKSCEAVNTVKNEKPSFIDKINNYIGNAKAERAAEKEVKLRRAKEEARALELMSAPALPSDTPAEEPVEPIVEKPESKAEAFPPPMIIPPFRPEPVEPYFSDGSSQGGKYDGAGAAQELEGFTLPEGEEFLTVSKLEEILNRHEAEGRVYEPELSVEYEEAPAPAVDAYQSALPKADHISTRVYGTNYGLSFDILDNPPADQKPADPEELRMKADMLLSKLRDFGVDGRIREIRPGPVVTLFELEPAPGIKINKIANLENDLALAMSAISIRIIAPIPGKAAVGIEVPNADRAMVSMRELLETKEFKEERSPLAVALGKDISGRPYYNDLRKMPHLLVAGTTGSGKSVCVNTIICSILYKSSPDAVKFVMIDPKMVELSVYEGIPHLMAPVVTDPRKASLVLQNVVKEMEQRYALMASCKVRSIDSYNEMAKSNSSYNEMPYMVVIVDEFADLMMVAGKDVENSIIRIAQMARAVGIHLVLATQRPSVNVITGIIKANMPARISFRVSSKIDSRTILDQNGAELLLGKGDSLFIPPGSSDPLRIHGSFVSEKEVLRVVDALKAYGEPQYNMDLLEDQSTPANGDEADDVDELYGEAVKIARDKGSVSVSMIQRHLRIGYNRAARIVEEMERRGLIGPSDGTSKPREVMR